ncbi:putative mediator of RNA polymerase II transcription subunit 26 isoform X3 [Drosophila sechellia]|nr:putative mediator of RNA polymerase II transcription subunit 26 isoform X3 [Drosophila sechellia]
MELFCIYLILATAIVVQGYRKFGLNCEDIACISGKKCIVSRVPCENPDQQEGEQCGTYPECQSASLGETMTDPEMDSDATLSQFHNRSARQIPMRPMPGPMPMPGAMPYPGPVPMNAPAPGRAYYPSYMGQPYVGQPMPGPMPGAMPMMPMMPQGGGAMGGTSIIVEPLLILPMGIGAGTGTGVNQNPYYGPNGAYPTYNNYNPYNTYTTARPNYDYNNYNNNNNNYPNYNNNNGNNNNYNDYNSYG